MPIETHPAFLGREIPAQVSLGPFRLVRLGPEVVEEDYAAVMASEAALVARFGPGWPTGLTLEANAVDLAWHLREFEAGRSFAWVIRDAAGVYLGCAYVYLGWSEVGPMKPEWWFRSGAVGPETPAAFRALFLDWLGGAPWPALPTELDPRLE